MRFKLHSSTVTKCSTCRSGVVLEDYRDVKVYCRFVGGWLGGPVVECSSYKRQGMPELWQMREIAWSLMTDKKGHKVGFRAPEVVKELKEKGFSVAGEAVGELADD